MKPSQQKKTRRALEPKVAAQDEDNDKEKYRGRIETVREY